MKTISEGKIESALSTLNNWENRENSIHKVFIFKSFVEAFGFMTQIAMLAERSNHHPQWSNSYNKLSVELSTHEVGGVTQKDIDLATQMDQLFCKFEER